MCTCRNLSKAPHLEKTTKVPECVLLLARSNAPIMNSKIKKNSTGKTKQKKNLIFVNKK